MTSDHDHDHDHSNHRSQRVPDPKSPMNWRVVPFLVLALCLVPFFNPPIWFAQVAAVLVTVVIGWDLFLQIFHAFFG